MLPMTFSRNEDYHKTPNTIGDMTEDNIDRPTTPGKWQKRGVMPEIKSDAPDPVIKAAKLARLIREESDPIRKAELEDQFRKHEEEFNAIHPDDEVIDLADVYREITNLAIPEDMRTQALATLPIKVKTQEEWRGLHGSLVTIKRRTSNWLSRSRKYARDNWGAKFLKSEESQMELALGIEKTEPPAPDMIESLEKIIKRLNDWRNQFEKSEPTEEQKQRAVGILAAINATSTGRGIAEQG